MSFLERLRKRKKINTSDDQNHYKPSNPLTFLLCQDLVAPGGIIANIGVHGTKVDLHLERLWSENIAITTRLVDTVSTPMLLKTVQSKKINPKLLITHRFKLDKILDAYETFGHAASTGRFEGDH
jgi:alcohol dehydrogenase